MDSNSSILSALQSQLDCYRRLAKLAELQHDHVQHSRTEDLLEVLGRRQHVLNEVALLEQTVAPVRRGWAEFAGGMPADERNRAEALLAETRSLLEAITAADRNDTMVLQQRKLNLGRQIHQASSARQVNRNYAAAAYGPRASRMDMQT